MATKKCGNCTAENHVDASFCWHCKVSHPKGKHTKKSAKKSAKKK